MEAILGIIRSVNGRGRREIGPIPRPMDRYLPLSPVSYSYGYLYLETPTDKWVPLSIQKYPYINKNFKKIKKIK